jgi:hypothetical protein
VSDDGLSRIDFGLGDKTNYDVIPVGYTGTSDLNQDGKVAYLNVPKDPTDCVISGVLDNSLRSLGVATIWWNASAQLIFSAHRKMPLFSLVIAL